MKFAFVAAEKACFPVTVMCRHLGVSTSGFYASQKRPESTRAVRDRDLAAMAQAAHLKGRGTYGSPRVHAVLKADGQKVGRKRVARVMREAGIRARQKRRFVPKTTDSKHSGPIAPNVVARDFTADAPNKVWVTDITYISTQQGWLYLAAILDLFSRKIVGWAMDATMPTELALAALQMACTQRQPPTTLIHHSDRGSVYASEAYIKALEARGITRSMSGKGDCWDNAVAERFFGGIKKEFIHDVNFETGEEAKTKIFEWIEVFYNRERLHSTLSYVSPDAFEKAHRGQNQAA